MTFRFYAAALVLAGLLVAACSGAGVTGPAATRSDALVDALGQQPEMADVLSRIEGGDCGQVLPMLTVYAGQDERSQLLDYLLGRAYGCTGDWPKAVFHLRRAWMADKALRSDIRLAARQSAEGLSAQFSSAGGLSYPLAKAAAGLYAFGKPDWYTESAGAMLLAYFDKQMARGEYAGALRTAKVLKRIGAPLAASFEPEAKGHIRLGDQAALEALVTESRTALGPEQGARLYRLGQFAEAAFRHDMAAWLFARCKEQSCPAAHVGQDLTRTLLKAERSDEARIEYQDYLAGVPQEEKAKRSLEIARLLQRHDRFQEVYDVLAAAIKVHPTQFALVKAAASLHEKLPGTVNVTALFSGYLRAKGSTRQALAEVGDQCIEWRLPNAGLPLLPSVEESADPDLVLFYRGTFQWLSARVGKADEAFAGALKVTDSKARMLGRIASFMVQVGEAKRARKYYEKALKADPTNVDVLLALASLLEEEKAGRGLKMLKRRVSRKAGLSAHLAAAAWCEQKGEVDDALYFARKALKLAKGPGAAKAHLMLGKLQMSQGREAQALAQFEQAFKLAEDPSLVATTVFALASPGMSREMACFLAKRASALGQAGTLPPQLLEVGGMAALRCGNPDVALLAQVIATAKDPSAIYLQFFGAAHNQAGRLALGRLEAQWPAGAGMSSPLLAQLVLLFAQQKVDDKTLHYARELVRTGGAARRDQYAALAARILPQGAVNAARELLRAAFEFGYASGKGAGSEHAVTYAGLLFANGEDDAGMAVLKRMLGGTFDPADAVVGATLLVDAGKYPLAFEIARDAVLRFSKTRAQPAGLPTEGGEPLDPRKLSKSDLMALLQKRPALNPEEARRQLVGLAAYAWKAQNLPWADFLKEMRPVVRPFNGEYLLASTLHRLDATQAALELLEEVFDETPGELQLFKAYGDALVYADYVADRRLDGSSKQIETLAKRFVKAREGDPDAYRLAAGYLEGKGHFAAAASLLSDLADATSVDAPLALALARNQLSQGQTAKAATHFSLAAQLSACNRKTVDPIIDELERVARLDLAVDIVRECARRFPKDAYLHLVYGRVLLAGIKETSEDGSALARVLKAAALDANLRLDAVRLLQKYGKGKAAWPLLESMAKDKDPGLALKALEIGFDIASEVGDVDAMTRLGAVASRAHRDPGVASELAGVYFKFNLPEQGLAKLKAAEGKDDISSLLLGIRLITNSKAKEGLKRLRSHTARTFKGRKPDTGPMDAKAYKPLSVQLDFLEDMGLNKDAVELLQAALRVYPEDARLQLRLMERLAVAGKFGKVAKMVSKVVREWPGGEERKRLVRVIERFRIAGRLASLRQELVASCPSMAEEGCLLPALLAAGLDGDGDAIRGLVDAALGSTLPAIRLADIGDELVNLGYYAIAEELLSAALARTVGRPTPVLTQVHRSLARIYSATGKRGAIDELNRLFLLHPATRAEVRAELPENLVDYEYLDAALAQLRLVALTSPDGLKAELAAFDVLLRKQDFDAARSLALSSAFRAENVLNALLTYASLARRKLVFDLAAELYLVAHELDETNLALTFALAELELVLGQKEAALKHFERYVGTGDGARARTAEVVRNLAKYDRLGAAEEQAETSGDPHALLEVGLNLLRAGNKSQAARFLGLAYKAADKDKAGIGRKVLYFGVERPFLLPDAVVSQAMKAACTGQSTPAICRFWEGRSRLESGDLKAAVKVFETQLEGSNETWLFTLAAVRELVRRGHDKAAEALLRQRMLGFNEVQVLNEAVKTVVAVLEEEAPNPQVRKAVLGLGLRLVESLLAHAPYDFWFRTQKAELILMSGDGERALTLYETYLKETPWDPGLSNNVAYLLSKEGKALDRALTLVKKALADEPSHSAFYLDTEGWVRYKMGQMDQAESLIRAALLRSHLGFGDALSESLYHLGQVQLDAGKTDDALQVLRLASVLDPYGQYGRLAREILVKQGVDVYGMETPSKE